jgi:hypothetical protein
MIFAQKVLAPRAWHPTEGHLQMAPNSIRFERFPVFQAFGFSGGHDSVPSFLAKKPEVTNPLQKLRFGTFPLPNRAKKFFSFQWTSLPRHV